MAPRWCGAETIGLAGIAGFTVVSQIYGTCTLISRVALETRTASLGDAFAQGDLSGARMLLDGALVRLILGILGLHLFIAATVMVIGHHLPDHARPGPDALSWSAIIAVLDVIMATRERWLFGRGRTTALSVASLFAAGIAIASGMAMIKLGGGINHLFAATALGFAIQAGAAVWMAGRHGYHRSP
jgi:hypothetical protein